MSLWHVVDVDADLSEGTVVQAETAELAAVEAVSGYEVGHTVDVRPLGEPQRVRVTKKTTWEATKEGAA